MTILCMIPDDAIVDFACGQPSQATAVDFVADCLVPDIHCHGDDQADDPEIEHIVSEAKEAQVLRCLESDELTAAHPLSRVVDEPDFWKDFENDIVSPDVECAPPDRARSHVFVVGRRSGRAAPFFTSSFVHASLLCLMAFVPVSHVAGTTDGTGDVISMRVIAHEEVIPQDPSPGAIDSAESAASKMKKENREQQQPDPPKLENKIDEAGPDPGQLVMQEKAERKENGDSAQDSVPSLPSTASAERRFLPAAGQAGNAFDALILSAIREAIFFPKAAVNLSHYGEVVVAFSIAKDGSLKGLRINNPSESSHLNEAALKIVEKASKKFPPIPDTVLRDSLDYVVPILFRAKKSS